MFYTPPAVFHTPSLHRCTLLLYLSVEGPADASAAAFVGSVSCAHDHLAGCGCWCLRNAIHTRRILPTSEPSARRSVLFSLSSVVGWRRCVLLCPDPGRGNTCYQARYILLEAIAVAVGPTYLPARRPLDFSNLSLVIM